MTNFIFAANSKIFWRAMIISAMKGQRTEKIFLAESVIQVATRRTSIVNTLVELKIAHKIRFC